MDNITGELLRRILAGESVNGFELGKGNYTGPQPTESNDQTGDLTKFEDVIYQADPRSSGTTARWNTWNTDGTYRGYGSGPGQTIDDIVMLLTGLGLGGAAAGAGGSSMSGLDAAMIDAGAGATNVGAAGGAVGGAAGGAGAVGGGAGGLSGWDAAMAGADGLSGAGAGATNVGAVTGGGLGSLGMSDLAKLGLAGLAAYDSRDQQSTSSRDPWGPAQPYLRAMMADGASLYDRYKNNPFSEQQKTAYNNLGGLLNTINSNAGGLMSGFQANASGANNYDRSNPRRQLTGSTFDMSQFMPGLLNFFKG